MSDDPAVSASGFARESLAVLQNITGTAQPQVASAAELFAECVTNNGVIRSSAA